MKGILVKAHIGYSRGKIDNILNDPLGAKFTYQNFFFRSGIILDYGKMEFSFSTRFLTLDYLNGEVNGNFNENDWFLFRLNKDVTEQDQRHLKESILRLSLKTKFITFFGDYNTIRNKNSRSLKSAYFRKQYYSLGLTFKISKWFSRHHTK